MYIAWCGLKEDDGVWSVGRMSCEGGMGIIPLLHHDAAQFIKQCVLSSKFPHALLCLPLSSPIFKFNNCTLILFFLLCNLLCHDRDVFLGLI